jgi:hypothetical protein
MTTSLQSTLNDLAASFANSILQAIRGMSLNDLNQANGQVRTNGRPALVSKTITAETSTPSAKKPARANGRLARRSPADIAAALGQVVALLKKNKAGLRAEQIRAELKMQAKEMPSVLKEGLTTKALKSKGQKRATTYFSAA